MQREGRRAAVSAYKERKADPGIYVVRCAASGQQWVGSAADLRTIWNRFSFMLRQGGARPASLQDAWRSHGAENFTFEVVERLDPETFSVGRDRTLRDRVEYWRDALPAELI